MRVLVTIAVLLFSLTGKAQESSYTLTIDFDITNYKTGSIYVAVYNSETSFLKKPLKGTIVTIKNGKATAKIEGLDTGEYAISSFYDKNGNGKLDTNFLGIPKEPTAMSNNAKGSFGPPKYMDAKFTVSNSVRINIKF